MVKGLKGSR